MWVLLFVVFNAGQVSMMSVPGFNEELLCMSAGQKAMSMVRPSLKHEPDFSNFLCVRQTNIP